MDKHNQRQLSLDFQEMQSSQHGLKDGPQAVVLSLVRPTPASNELRIENVRKNIALNEILLHARKLSW